MQSYIGLHQHVFEIRVLASMQARYAETRSYRHSRVAKRKPFCFDLFADAFDCQPDAVHFGIRCNQQEFVAADTTAYVALSSIGFEDFGELLEDSIPSIVPMRIVYGLELV